jgi:hypothetical protein
MLKTIATYILVLIFSLGIFSLALSHQAYAQEKSAPIDMEISKIEYDLPYPGMLPDHPLYVLKSTRDTLMVFFTRDHMKKAELLLLLSDKYTSMGIALAEEGQWGASAEALQQSEDTFAEMLDTVKTSQSQGVSPSEEFIQKITLSNDKHKEIIQQLLVTAPQGSRNILEETLHKNDSFKDIIKKFSAQ